MSEDAEVGRAWISILPSLKGFNSSITRGIAPGVDSAGRSSGRHFGEVFTKTSVGPLRAFGEAAAAIFAVDKVGSFFKSSIATARQAQVLGQETAKVIQTTGGAANITAGQVDKLATSISNNTGISRLQIAAGERLLLTYTHVRNEVGKGNDIFDQATKATNNLAAGMGTSLTSASRIVGRALNDPVKGLTLLTRGGIQLTTATTNTIKKLVAQGKTLQAQKLILSQLNIRYGGAAKASTTMGQKVGVAFENIKEKVGAALLPAIDSLEKGLLRTAFPALIKLSGEFNRDVVPSLKTFATYITTNIVPAIQRLVVQIGPPLVAALKTGFGFIKTDVIPVVKQLQLFIVNKLYPAIGSLLVSAIGDLRGYVQSLTATFQKHRAQIVEVLKAAQKLGGFLLKVLVPVIKVGLKIAFTELKIYIKAEIIAFGLLVDAVNGLIVAGKAVGRFFTGPFVGFFVKIGRAAKDLAHYFVGGFLRAIGSLVSVAVTGFQDLANVWFSVVGKIVDGGAKAFGWLPGVGGKIKGAARAFDGLKTNVTSTLSGIANEAKTWGARTAANYATGFVSGVSAHRQGVLNTVHNLMFSAYTAGNAAIKAKSPSKLTMKIGVNFMDGIIAGLASGTSRLKSQLASITKHLTDFASSLTKKIATIAKTDKPWAQFASGWLKDFTTTETKTLDGLGKHLDSLTTKFQNVKSASHSLSSGIAGNLISGASLGNAATATVTGGIGFLRQEAIGEKAFLRNLALMRKHGFSDTTVNDIDQLGLDAGGPLAAQYAHATARQVRRIDSLEHSIHQTAHQIGNQAAAATYNPQLDRLSKQLEHQTKVIAGDGRRIVAAERQIARAARAKARAKAGKSQI